MSNFEINYNIKLFDKMVTIVAVFTYTETNRIIMMLNLNIIFNNSGFPVTNIPLVVCKLFLNIKNVGKQ